MGRMAWTWLNGRMGYTDGEYYAVLAAIIVALTLWFFSLSRNKSLSAPMHDPRKRPLRTLALCVLRLGIGISWGIEMTATGRFWMPPGVMAEQLREPMWRTE